MTFIYQTTEYPSSLLSVDTSEQAYVLLRSDPPQKHSSGIPSKPQNFDYGKAESEHWQRLLLLQFAAFILEGDQRMNL
jgi:hypothetical protein